jgi:hypothetical protein
MRRLNLFIAVLAALILPLGAVMAAPAMAYNISAVYKDCEVNGQLTKSYPRAELQSALSSLPAQVKEYSSCADVIRQALLRASSGGGGIHANSKSVLAGGGRRGGGGHGGKGSALRHGGQAGTSGAASTKTGRPARAGNANAVDLSGSSIRPGSTGTAAATSSLPTALIVVLVLLALTAVSGGAVAIRRRVDARQGT